MKIRRTLSELLLGFGFAVVFIGLLALILPGINNPQINLIIQSLQAASRLSVINLINRILLFVIDNAWKVLGFGAFCLLLGFVLFFRFSEKDHPVVIDHSAYIRPADEPASPPSPEKNPFAVAQATESEVEYEVFKYPEVTTDILAYRKPLLEENRIDESQPYLPVTFEEESLSVLSDPGLQSPGSARTIPSAPQDLPAEEEVASAAGIPTAPIAPPAPIIPLASPIPEAPSLPPAKVVSAPAAQSPEPSASPRIRSTMGRHKQW